jgi:tripartite-type tricarboxylate transporter receptor subunit TctC
MSRALLSSLAAVATVVLAGPAAAQTYPTRPITLVVPISAGAGMDVMARIFAKSMSQRLGQAIVVDNRPGGSGNIGHGYVARSTPDGYTLLFTTANLGMAPVIAKDLAWDPVKDFAPVAMLADTPLLLAVNRNLPVNNLSELIALVQRRPGELNYATPGPATIHHFAMEVLRERTGMNMVHIPYSGVAAALTDLARGEVQAGFFSQANLQPLGDKVRILATSSEKRLPDLPQVPTLREENLSDGAVQVWIGMFAPAGTPAGIIAKLSQEAIASMHEDGVVGRMTQIGIIPTPASAQRLGEQLKREIPQWRRIAVAAKIKSE